MALDPHTDTTPHARDVPRLLDETIRDAPFYVIRAGEPAKCLTCGNVRELRFGHCWPCVEATKTA